MNKIKVLFVAEEFSINGAMKSLLALVKALPKEKYDITLFLFKSGGFMLSQIPNDVKVLPEILPYAVFRMPLKDALSLSLRRLRFDLILFRCLVAIGRFLKFNSFGLWKFLPQIPGEYDLACGYTDGFVAPTVIKKVKAKRKVNWIHFIYSNWTQPKYVYKALIESDLCIPVSMEAGKDLDQVLCQKTRQHIIHNITDVDECWDKASEPCEVPKRGGVYRILSVGRMSPNKNFSLIPQVAKILRIKNIPFEWFIIGNGNEYDKLVTQTRKAGLHNCVHFIGSRTNPMPWLKTADIFVNPSAYESWGMTVSEALCMGKAVITSDIPVFAEQINNRVNGLMCPTNAESLADAILELLNDQSFREYIERNAFQYPFTKYKIIEEFNEIFQT